MDAAHRRGAAADRRIALRLGRPAGRAAPAGGIAILGFLVGLAISTAITVVLILFGYTVEDPALLLGSSLGLWVGMFGSCVIAVRTKGTGSLADLGLVKPQWVDVRARHRLRGSAAWSWSRSSGRS